MHPLYTIAKPFYTRKTHCLYVHQWSSALVGYVALLHSVMEFTGSGIFAVFVIIGWRAITVPNEHSNFIPILRVYGFTVLMSYTDLF